MLHLLKISRVIVLPSTIKISLSNLKNVWFSKKCSTSPLTINTNVIKDVILFKYDNPKFFKILNLFALCQFGFWTYLTVFSFSSLRDAPVSRKHNPDELPWWRKINFGDNTNRNIIAGSCFFIGYGILMISWMFTLRSVRYLILRKGGDQVSFVTYSPFGYNRITTVSLSQVSSKETRSASRSQLPIKVKNHAFHYILDMKGEFKNVSLFDSTAGLKRRL